MKEDRTTISKTSGLQPTTTYERAVHDAISGQIASIAYMTMQFPASEFIER